jgi:uncharacterized protein YcbX
MAAMLVGIIRDLWRYPVKSMRGEQLEWVRVCERGVDGDRLYAVRDCETGKIASAKHPRLWGTLLRCAAHYIDPEGPKGPGGPEGEVAITLPSGQQLTSGQDDLDAALCALTGRVVQLADSVPEHAEIERYWPDVDGLAPRETLRESVTASEIGLGTPGRTFFDYAPLHMLTTASLAMLAALHPHPSGSVDSRRFRPNVVIETSDETRGFVENGWVGHRLLIGADVSLRVSNPTPRCVVPTLRQGPLAADTDVLRTIADHNRPPVPALGDALRPCLGIYASVERSGVVRVGDTVHMADVD